MVKVAHGATSALVLAAALAVAPAEAETINLKANLRGTVATSGRGSLTVTYDTASKRLTWTGTVSGLTGEATAAHFHGPAEPGRNAGVLIPASGVKSGSFEGSATLTDAQASALTAGQTYFNIHTTAHPQGEVQGQVTR
jgi:hypothetical protein